MADTPRAIQFIEALHNHQSDEELKKIQRYFKTGKGEYGEGDTFIGVRMKHVFDLAKAHKDMPLSEIETLLESDIHEARAGAVKIMAVQAKHKKTPDDQRKALYELYLRRHDRVNNWDLVDLGAWHVVGSYLYDYDRPREILYEMARSENMWERRTAILSTLYFIRNDELDDALKLAEVLLDDDEDLIHKPIGWTLREIGKRDRSRLTAFLDQYAATMPRTALRYAIEHFDKDLRRHYMDMKKEPKP
jgi:3-methyladenine DNA glycosylase AlkD